MEEKSNLYIVAIVGVVAVVAMVVLVLGIGSTTNVGQAARIEARVGEVYRAVADNVTSNGNGTFAQVTNTTINNSASNCSSYSTQLICNRHTDCAWSGGQCLYT